MKRISLTPRTRLLLVAGALLLVVLLFFVFRKPAVQEDAKAGPQPALTVTVARPSSDSLPLTLGANGNVAAWQEASIGSEAMGLRLAEVRVNVGDVVKKGEVLAVFASETVNADVQQARAALMEAQAMAQDAAANAARARSLRATGALSEQQIGQYTTAESTANARIAAAKATLEAQQVRLRQARVLAPDSGVISARSATVGAVAGAGTELFRMIRQGRLEWRAEVTANDVARIKPGAAAVVRAPDGSEARGRVRMIAPTVDPRTRTTLVYVDLPRPQGMNAPLKAGMFVGGRFELGTSSGITVPQQAVVVRDGFSYVFRLNRDNRVSQVKVQPGRRIGNRIEIVSGLAQDAQVVVTGAGFLNEGDLVRVAPAPAAG
ncbi:efflux RND transporter periplasmic adaptor subunit [Pseudoduganella sp. GCM10020061]|uniref:efflux RND transporter periplasmic adaptor subunit n=1 Tax=Pseudoduganella sp. GCM10020061 TaxID=3317345 RepID=UPI003645BA33